MDIKITPKNKKLMKSSKVRKYFGEVDKMINDMLITGTGVMRVDPSLMNKKKKIQRRIDLSGKVGTLIFNAIQAGNTQSIDERHEIATYFTKQICYLIANNYRRRK